MNEREVVCLRCDQAQCDCECEEGFTANPYDYIIELIDRAETAEAENARLKEIRVSNHIKMIDRAHAAEAKVARLEDILEDIAGFYNDERSFLELSQLLYDASCMAKQALSDEEE